MSVASEKQTFRFSEPHEHDFNHDIRDPERICFAQPHIAKDGIVTFLAMGMHLQSGKSSAVLRYAIPELRTLRVPGLQLTHIHWSPQFAPYKRDLEVLTNPNNVLHDKIRDRYAHLPNNTLRWQVLTVMSVKVLDKAVTRERLRRRHKEAYREALKLRGFDKDGKLLDNNGLKSPNTRPLFGTLEVHIHGGLGFHLKFPSLVQQAGRVIDAVKLECQKHAGRNSHSYRYAKDP